MLATKFSTVAAVLLSAVFVTAEDVYTPGSGSSTKIDYQPSFTSPSGGEIWIAGGQYSASWDQTVPADINATDVPKTADIKLGYTDSNSTSLHLQWTLASNVSLYEPAPNSVTFTLPDDLTTKTSYFLVLLGSTSDKSKPFTILANTLKKRDEMLKGASKMAQRSVKDKLAERRAIALEQAHQA